MSPRLPFLVLLTAVVGGVAYLGPDELSDVGGGAGAEAGGGTDVRSEPGLAVSAAQPEGAFGSTWYCPGGDTVVVVNPTGHQVSGRITAYGGDIAAPAPAAPALVPEATALPASHPTTSARPADPVVLQTGAEGSEATSSGAGSGGQARSASGRDEQSLEGFVVPERGQRVLRLAELVGEHHVTGAMVELDGGGVAVEQHIDRPEGSDIVACASVAARDWHVAWGSTSRDARELLVLFNPFRNDVTVDATFSTDAGMREPVRWQGLVVPAGRVVGVDLGQDVTRREQVSATLRSRGGGLVVSRIQSFDGSRDFGGLSLTLAQPEPAGEWMFGHGQVDERTAERIVLYNPGARPAEVDVALVGFGPDAPRPQPFGVVVRPRRFEVVDYTEESRVEPDIPHATVVRSTNGVPVVAERVLTFHTDAGTSTADDDSATDCRGDEGVRDDDGGEAEAGDDGRADGVGGDGNGAEGGDDRRADGTTGDGGEGEASDDGQAHETGDRDGADDEGERRGNDQCRDRRRRGGGEVAAAPGAVLARAWAFAAPPGDDESSVGVRLTVLNPHPRRAARVSVAVDADGRRSRPAELHDVAVEPDSRTTLRLSDLPSQASVLVESDRPVVAERTVVRHHQIVAVGPGVPIPVTGGR